MDAGGVQVQHQPSNQDPTRQSWRNTSNNSSPGDQGKRRDNNKGKPVSLKSINVERAQNLGSAPRTNNVSSATQRTPKTAQFSRQQTSASPPKTIFISSKSENSDVSASVGAVSQQKLQKSTGSMRPIPKPLNLSKSSQMQNFGRVPQTATFPPKVNRALNLPQPPKTATFAKPQGFPKDIRQAVRVPQAYAFVYGDQTYIQAVPESPRLRRYSASPAPLRFVPPNYRQVEMSPGTPVVVLSHPEDSDSQGSSPPTPGIFPEGYGTELYDTYVYDEELEDNQFYYYCYDYSQEYIPQTPTGTSYPRSNTLPITSKDQRRRSVLSGPMKVHPDAILPVRQPKGPDMAKNFATRIRRKAVNKLYAAAAERRSKSAADRRKSALF